MNQLFRKKDISESVKIIDALKKDHKLERTLTLRDLTSFGIAAIIGAGIFGTIGNASAAGGPAVSLLFVFTAVACLFSALCYAEFASGIPLAGSAYTYAYTSFGELVAWIIGWDLIMEYAIGNIAVAISWSDYFTGFLHGFDIDVPHYLSMDYLSATRGHDEVVQHLKDGQSLDTLSNFQQAAYSAWENAPSFNNIKIIADIPALVIVFLITLLVYVGIKETRRTANAMVMIKLLVIAAVILTGAFYINTENWTPFAPRGFSGVLTGVSAVFFAYIGFDAISTTAEETKDPQRTLPLSMIYSLVICTVLYVAIALVLTGMVPYTELAVGDPLSFVFEKVGLDVFSGIIALSAIVAMSGVLLVFQMGQPRIWMSMSRDGLLPSIFSKIHPRYHTPSFATIVTGFLVAIPALFMNLEEVTDLTSIGTLFAFAVVCGGILIKEPNKEGFKITYINSKYIIGPAFLCTLLLISIYAPDYISLSADRIPFLIFVFATALLSIACYRKNLSLIPVLGLLSNLYLMSELGITNWLRFLIWLAIGLVVYFLYGYKKSKIRIARK
jgi:basic amino acid/polyamine antiporter, APA family